MRYRLFLPSSVLLIGVCFAVAAWAQPPIERPTQIKAISNEAANQMGIPLFDLRSGVAFLEQKDYPRAFFAFERVLLTDPKHFQARVYFIKTLVALKDYAAAARNAKKLKELPNLSPEQTALAKCLYEQTEHLKFIDSLKIKPVRMFMLQVSEGHDSNVRRQNEASQIETPEGLEDTGVGLWPYTSDYFLRGKLFFLMNHPFTDGFALGVQGLYFSNDFYRLSLADAEVKAVEVEPIFSHDRFRLKFPIQWTDIVVNGLMIQKKSKVSISFNTFINPSHQVELFVDHFNVLYGASTNLNHHMIGFGGKWIYLSPDRRLKINALWEWDNQNAKLIDYAYKMTHETLLRIKADYEINNRHEPYAQWSLIHATYQGLDDTFGIQNISVNQELKLGWNYRATRSAKIFLEGRFEKNRSTIPWDPYFRKTVELGWTYFIPV